VTDADLLTAEGRLRPFAVIGRGLWTTAIVVVLFLQLESKAQPPAQPALTLDEATR